LIYTEFTYNNSIQASTGYSPFKLLYGQDATTPSAITSRQELSQVPAAQDLITNMQDYVRIAKEQLSKAHEHQALYANKYRRDEVFQEGDQVLLSTVNLHLASQAKQPTRKFLPRFVGPYRIMKQISPVAYELELPATWRIHPVFYISLLKRHTKSDTFKDRQEPPPDPVLVEDHAEYEVEKVLDKRKRYNRTEYLVKWQGYPDYDSTWESVVNLRNARQAVEDFEKTQQGGQQ
jgi:hypothetical protein